MLRLLLIFFGLPLLSVGQVTILTGQIWDPVVDSPVANADIKLYLGNVSGERIVQSNDEGKFTFTVSASPHNLDYAIMVQKDNYYRLNGSVRLNYGEGPDRHFNLYRKKEPEAPKVVWEEDGPSLLGAPTNNLIFLIDVSGSMAEQDRLENVKKSLSFLVGLYRKEDQITIITYSSNVNVMLEGGRISDRNNIDRIISELQPEGTTEGVAGLLRAYDLAGHNFVRGGNNKVILATDGIFGSDKKSRKLVEDVILRGRSQDVNLSIFSFGEETASIVERLDSWSKTGDGHHTHINTLEEAKEQIVLEARGQ